MNFTRGKIMQIEDENWERICKFWGKISHATASPNIPYCVFATVNEDGSPRIAPYSSLILCENKKGFFFDQFAQQMTKNFDRDRKISILLLKTSRWFWVKAVLFGKFDHAPGIRLMGSVGKKREAEVQEIDAFKRSLRMLKSFRGYEPLWGNMKYCRDILFESFETVKCGPMKYSHNSSFAPKCDNRRPCGRDDGVDER